jgi:hypothetical protein
MLKIPPKTLKKAFLKDQKSRKNANFQEIFSPPYLICHTAYLEFCLPERKNV